MVTRKATTLAYRNKYDGRCNSCGEHVATQEGWVVLGSEGSSDTWMVLCDEHAEGYRKVDSLTDDDVGSKSKRKGVTTGFTQTEMWAEIFKENERCYHGKEKTVTDEQIGKMMLNEFPGSPAKSKTPDKVRSVRRIYNRGAYGFVSPPEYMSFEYDSNRRRVNELQIRCAAQRRGKQQQHDAPLEIDVESIKQMVLKELAEKIGSYTVDVHFRSRKVKRTSGEGKHKKFAEVLKKIEAGIPVLLVGPTGSGKTHLAGQIAEALDLRYTFNSMSEGVSESALMGRVLPNADGEWKYQASPFVESYKKGGVHLFDEIDGADANLLVAMNSSLSNKMLSLPFADTKPVKMHEDFVPIAAANTFGRGADRQYVGRNQLDEATLNRFQMGTVEIDYDVGLEAAIATAIYSKPATKELLRWSWHVRDRISQSRLRRTMSTRNIQDGAKLLAVGMSLEDVKDTYFSGWTDDEKRKVSE